jgi:hypothetical protein
MAVYSPLVTGTAAMNAARSGSPLDDDALWDALVRNASSQLPPDVTPVAAPTPPAEAARPAAKQAAPRPRRQRTSRYRNITRFDYGNTHGYFVRLSWKHDRRSKFFSDGKYGDRLAALAAAIAWRDQTCEEMGKPNANAPTRKDLGIHRRTKEGRDVFEATWYEDGRHRRTSFSVRKHGVKQARALAIEARARALKAYQDRLKAEG